MSCLCRFLGLFDVFFTMKPNVFWFKNAGFICKIPLKMYNFDVNMLISFVKLHILYVKTPQNAHFLCKNTRFICKITQKHHFYM
jgi:adenine-specific DNA methylase